MRRWSRARGRPRRMWRSATSWRARRRAFRSTRPSVRGQRGPCRLCPCPRPSPLGSGWWRRSTPARDPPIPRHTSRLKKRRKRSCRGQLPVQKNTRPGGRKNSYKRRLNYFLTMYFWYFLLTSDWFFHFFMIFCTIWIFFLVNEFLFSCYVSFLLTWEILDANLSKWFYFLLLIKGKNLFESGFWQYGMVRSKIWSQDRKMETV